MALPDVPTCCAIRNATNPLMAPCVPPDKAQPRYRVMIRGSLLAMARLLMMRFGMGIIRRCYGSWGGASRVWLHQSKTAIQTALCNPAGLAALGAWMRFGTVEQIQIVTGTER